jgi:hypothetical protein
MVNFIESLFSLPAQVDQWIVLLYVVLVLAGARIVEFVAKKHYERARNFAVLGFEYLEQEDQYRCPEGEHLKLLKLDNENRLAVYQISTSCQSCRLKESCTPHSHARQITRSVATWAEAEVGKFHRRISAIMFLAATLVCALCLLLWVGKSGTGLFVVTQVVSVNFLIHEIRAILECPVSAVERSASRTNRFLEKTALLNRGSKPSVSNRVF